MAKKNDKVAGTNWNTPTARIKPTDLNDTFDATIDLAAIGQAQTSYQILQANNVFGNKDYLAADEFTDSNGTNNTVNTGSSTANYSSPSSVYGLEINTGVTTETSDSVPSNSNFTNNQIRTSISISGTGIFTNVTFGNGSNGFNYTVNIEKNGTIIASKSGLTVNGANSVDFVSSDYSDVLVPGDTCVIEVDANDKNFQDSQSYSGTLFSYSSERVPTVETTSLQPFTFTDASFESPRKLVCDSNILTLDGTEKSLCIYTDSVQTANTSITVDISDGTTTISGQSVSNNTTGVINISSLSSGTLELTYNLATTNTSETPKFYGYGVYLYK